MQRADRERMDDDFREFTCDHEVMIGEVAVC